MHKDPSRSFPRSLQLFRPIVNENVSGTALAMLVDGPAGNDRAHVRFIVVALLMLLSFHIVTRVRDAHVGAPLGFTIATTTTSTTRHVAPLHFDAELALAPFQLVRPRTLSADSRENMKVVVVVVVGPLLFQLRLHEGLPQFGTVGRPGQVAVKVGRAVDRRPHAAAVAAAFIAAIILRIAATNKIAATTTTFEAAVVARRQELLHPALKIHEDAVEVAKDLALPRFRVLLCGKAGKHVWLATTGMILLLLARIGTTGRANSSSSRSSSINGAFPCSVLHHRRRHRGIIRCGGECSANFTGERRRR